MSERNAGAGKDPNIDAIAGLSNWVALIAAPFLMLEYWADYRGLVINYLTERIPFDWLNLAVIAAPWVTLILAFLVLRVLISTVLSKVYFALHNA